MKSPLGTLLNKAPVPYSSSRARLSLPFIQRNDSEAQMRAMGSVGTLFSIVHRTSNATSQVDWKLYRKSASGKEEDRVEVTRHAALDTWNKPNKFYTRQEFVETFQQHIDLTGEGWWVVARDPRVSFPLELWPVRPDRMTPVPHPTDFLSGYMYTGPEGEKVPLELDEVIQLRMPNPLDPYRGMGPVQALMTDLDSVRYSAEWNRAFFLNSAEPGGVIEFENNLSDDEFNEARDRWNEQHKGVNRAHRVAILERGTWKERKYTNRDMQFVELRRAGRDTIMEAFGMPTTMLGITEDVNRANAEAGEVVFSRWLSVPRLERIKGALNNDYLPLFGSPGQGLEFDYVNPVPPDRDADNAERTSRANAVKTLVEAGYDPADVAEYMGLPPMRYARRDSGVPVTQPAA